MTGQTAHFFSLNSQGRVLKVYRSGEELIRERGENPGNQIHELSESRFRACHPYPFLRGEGFHFPQIGRSGLAGPSVLVYQKSTITMTESDRATNPCRMSNETISCHPFQKPLTKQKRGRLGNKRIWTTLFLLCPGENMPFGLTSGFLECLHAVLLRRPLPDERKMLPLASQFPLSYQQQSPGSRNGS